MRHALTLAVLILSPCLPVIAQSAAQRALANEPEVRQVNSMSADMTRQSRLPSDDKDKPSPVGMAASSTMTIRQMNVLMDRLEERLNRETRACNLCADKQDELSELVRERVALLETTAHNLGSDRAGFMLHLAGMTPGESRWTNIALALREASDALAAHCTRFRGAQESYCTGGAGGDGAKRLAGEHENAWAACFNKHNWVEQSSDRRAYETCLLETDPFTKLCEQDRRASPPITSCPYFTVNSSDVDQLHFYHDRWVTDPNRLSATATIVANQPAHVTLLEPVTAPAMPSTGGFGFKITVRGRLDNAIHGEYSRGLNPTTANSAVINPGVNAGLNGRVELISAGTEVPVTVTLAALGGERTNGGQLSLQITTTTLGESKNNQFLTQQILQRVPWPAAGTVLLAANSSLSFAMQCGCPYSMSVAEFRKRAAAYDAAPPASAAALASRPILMGSRIQTVLLEPINLAGIQSGKRFHAQLNVDMTPPSGSTRRDDAIELKRGTDVYLMVIDPNPTQPGGHMARLAVDYVVVDGQNIPVKTAAWPLQFSMPNPNARSRAPIVDVVQPTGHTAWWDIVEQAELSTAKMSGEQLKRSVPPPDPSEQATKGDDALRRAIADYNATWIGHGMIAKGTIARVEQQGNWAILHFQEAPTDAVIACFSRTGLVGGPTDDLGKVGGKDFSGLVGKTIELRGRITALRCVPNAIGMEVTMPNQVRVY